MGGELALIQGPGAGQTFLLTGTEAVLGREPGSTILLADNSVSRRHARVVSQNNAWFISDLNSANGTMLNGMRLGQVTIALKPGDVIQIGPFVMRYQDGMARTQAFTGQYVQPTVPLGNPGPNYGGGLPPHMGSPEQPPPGMLGLSEINQKKIIAGILAILVGGLGIHGFYIGNNRMGITFLVIALISLPLACLYIGYLGIIALNVISTIQGVIYLISSDHDYYQKYMVEKRWM